MISLHLFLSAADDGEGVSESGSSRLRCGRISVRPRQSGLCCLPVLRDNWWEDGHDTRHVRDEPERMDSHWSVSVLNKYETSLRPVNLQSDRTNIIRGWCDVKTHDFKLKTNQVEFLIFYFVFLKSSRLDLILSRPLSADLNKNTKRFNISLPLCDVSGSI